MHELGSALCTMMREKAPGKVVLALFNNLYPEHERQPYDLFACYIVHYDYQDVDIKLNLLMHESEFNPFLTAAHENKSWIFTEEKIRKYRLDKDRIFCKVFTAAYGIFEEDTIQTDRKIMISDIFFPRDDLEHLEHYLTSWHMKPQLSLMIQAARYGAKNCCAFLLRFALHSCEWYTNDPAKLLEYFMFELLNISDVTVDNALCVFKFISEKFPYLNFPRLNGNDKDMIKRISDDIDMIISSSDFSEISNKLQSVPIGCDLNLFSRVFLQSCESLLEILKRQNNGLVCVLKEFRNQYERLINRIYMPKMTKRAMTNERMHCGIWLLTRLTKIMLNFGVEPPAYKFQGEHFRFYNAIISATEKNGISVRIAELFRVQLAHGWIHLTRDCDWLWLEPKRLDARYHVCMIEAIQEGIRLLPKEIYGTVRNKCMTKADDLVQEHWESDDAPTYQKVFDIYNRWFKKECRSLKDLCRLQLYQIIPRGKVPIHAERWGFSKTLKSYMTLDTDEL